MESIVYVHEISRKYLEKTDSISFQAYITPKHYLEFIKLYLHFFETKNFKFIEQVSINIIISVTLFFDNNLLILITIFIFIVSKNNFYENAIDKVNEAIKDLRVLQIKKDAQKSIVKEKEDICKTISMTMSKGFLMFCLTLYKLCCFSLNN